MSTRRSPRSSSSSPGSRPGTGSTPPHGTFIGGSSGADPSHPRPRRLRAFLAEELRSAGNTEGSAWPDGLEPEVRSAAQAADRLVEDASALAARLGEWFDGMDFRFLYDRRRRLFRIGFSVATGELDPNHYDLLASESRIASTVAMAKDEAPPAHWLHLGRPFAWTDRGPVLLSWAGTMFEYLMPALFLRLPPESVLEEGCRRAVRVQRDHGRREGIPWGISESGYHLLSREGHYQYRAFGVPALGLSRTQPNRLVVAPYASLMAISFEPGDVHGNLAELEALGAIGTWGSLRGSRLRLHEGTGEDAADRPVLHGAPPGNDPRRARQPPDRPPARRALSQEPADRDDRAVPPRADPLAALDRARLGRPERSGPHRRGGSHRPRLVSRSGTAPPTGPPPGRRGVHRRDRAPTGGAEAGGARGRSSGAASGPGWPRAVRR